MNQRLNVCYCSIEKNHHRNVENKIQGHEKLTMAEIDASVLNWYDQQPFRPLFLDDDVDEVSKILDFVSEFIDPIRYWLELRDIIQEYLMRCNFW